MALSEARQLLDELMGRHRNADPTEKREKHQWMNPDVCKNYLVKFCPNDLFVNTKADLGPCEFIHDDHLREEYRTEATDHQKERYESHFIDMCQRLLGEVQKRIQRARTRLEMGGRLGSQAGRLGNQPMGPQSTSKESDGDEKSNGETEESTGTGNPLIDSADEKVKILSARIEDLLSKVELLGCEGRVEEAQALMKLCDELKEERSQITNTATQQWMRASQDQEKLMEVCEVCGAFLIIGDAQARVDDHLQGKQHVGFAKLKAAVVEYEERKQKEREMVIKEREDRRRERERSERDRERRRSRSRDRGRDRRDRSRERRDRSRDRERSRRDRSRDRHRSRSRSRDRRRNDRRRERSRSGDRRRRD